MAANRAVIVCPAEPPSNEGFGDQTSPTALGPTSGLGAVLGRLPWISRATAMWPDGGHVMQHAAKVKEDSER